jgi:hypothetical protein
MKPGAYERVRLTIATAAATPGVRSGAFDAVWAALFSSPMNYGQWTGHLPAKGSLVLLRHTEISPPETKDPKSNAVDSTNVCRTTGPLPSTAKRDLVLQPPLPSAVDTGVLLGSLALALITTLIAAAIIFRSTDLFLRGRMGDVTFDFRNSWGANVALGTGILSALTGGAVLSQDQYSSNSTTYLVLASLFTALLPLGAALYGLIRPQVSTGGGATQPQGYVGVYLLSSAIVLWGAFGQLLLLGMILRELALARVMSPEPALLLIFMTKGMIALLIAYAILNALATVKGTSEKPETPAGSTQRPAAAMI